MSAPAIPIFDIENNDATVPLLSASIIVPNHHDTTGTNNEQVVQIIAPSTLPSGYKFQASYNNEIFTVTVPDNGVVQGQIMYVTFRQSQQIILPIAVPVDEVTPLIVLTPATPILVEAATATAAAAGGNVQAQQVSYSFATATATTSSGTIGNDNNTNNNNIIISDSIENDGQWDDSCYDCCDYGCCHPSFCMSLFVPRIILGQIMTRLQLDMCGNVTRRQRTANNTCPTILLLVIVFYIFNSFRWKDIINNYSNDDDNIIDNFYYSLFHGYPIGSIIDVIFNSFMIVYFLYLLIKVRYVTRKKFNIPPTKRWWYCCCCCCCFPSCCHFKNGIWEDIYCSILFPFCTISQLARQTGNYDINKASYCTRNGLKRQSQHNSTNYHNHGPIQDTYPATTNNRRTYPVQV